MHTAKRDINLKRFGEHGKNPVCIGGYQEGFTEVLECMAIF